MLAAYAAQFGGGAAHNDEMLAPDGRVKPDWAEFIAHLSALPREALEARFARGDQYLRDAGVLYRQYDESLSSEREWPLSHIPVILGEAEWETLSAGLIERASLLDDVLRDFYGAGDLVRSGQLPASLLSQNPAWLRPMVGALHGDAPLLNTVSFEIGRGPDGKWWVLSDLVEAPSTAGFAIENRIAMTRVFPNFFATANIHRLAGYFQSFQQTLYDLKGRSEGDIALLSPGPMNQNYAEHAYLARYLGLLLVEGEDLIVQDGKAMVRTIAGLRPISLLWSRLPSAMFDPLELNPASMLGAPGLVQALRGGRLKTVNMVGAGVLETRALMAFFPKIARARLGRGLALPNIATWWCGHAAQRAHVLAQRGKMIVGDAFSTTSLMADPATRPLEVAAGAPMDMALGAPLDKDALAGRIAAQGHQFVGQEAVTLSTTPVFEEGRLVPRPMSLRISLGRTATGWMVMPGGYARISAGRDAKALAMQQGGKVADVWVTSAEPVQTPSLLAGARGAARYGAGTTGLPSRAADNLFWLGRYVERSEQNMRVFRAYYARISDGASHSDPFPAAMRARLMENVAPDAPVMAERFAAPLGLALQAATRISDRFSPDGMMALRSLVQEMQDLERRAVPLDDIPVEVSRLLRQISGFAGLVHENMYRSAGWRFLSIGVSLERAATMCTVLAASTGDGAQEGAEKGAWTGGLDLALEIGDSVVAHRAQHSIGARAASVRDLLGLDPQNPRSIRYHISRTKDHLAYLPRRSLDSLDSLDGTLGGRGLTDVARRVLLLETRLATTAPQDLTPDFLARLRGDIWDLSDALSASYLV